MEFISIIHRLLDQYYLQSVLCSFGSMKVSYTVVSVLLVCMWHFRFRNSTIAHDKFVGLLWRTDFFGLCWLYDSQNLVNHKVLCMCIGFLLLVALVLPIFSWFIFILLLFEFGVLVSVHIVFNFFIISKDDLFCLLSLEGQFFGICGNWFK